MTEGTPPTPPEQFRQLNRDLMEKVIDKAASDPAWKQRLLDDPEAAMAEAGFPEAQRLEELEELQEVQGQNFQCRSSDYVVWSRPESGIGPPADPLPWKS